MLDRFLAPVFYGSAGREPAAARVGEWALAAGSAAIAAVGTVAAWWIYLHEGVDRARLRKKFARLHDLMENAYAIDRLYDRLLVLPLLGVARACARAVDARLIDGAVNGLGRGALKVSGLLRQLQTGFVVNYAVAMLLGAVAVLAYFILGR
jgi:NADH-quinone oxidoreductase subunit L